MSVNSSPRARNLDPEPGAATTARLPAEAAGSPGAYLIHHHAISVEPVDGKFSFVIEQGDFINRPSRINLEVKGAPSAVEQVRVGGPSVVVAHGEVVF